MLRLIAFLARALALIIGKFFFEAPPWMKWVWRKLAQSFPMRLLKSRIEWAKQNPKQARRHALITVLVLVVLSAISYKGWLYYLSRPQPHFVEVSIQAPGVPDIETKEQQVLIVHFSESAAQLEQAGKIVESGVELSPAISGQWTWRDDRNLVFTPAGVKDPAGVWRVDQAYWVRLDKKLFPKHLQFNELSYKFMTPSISGQVENWEFFQDPVDPKIKRAIYTIRYNYEIDVEDFKKRVTLTLRSAEASVLGKAGKAFPFSITTGKFNNYLYVKSEPIPIPTDDSEMELEIGKGIRTANGGETKTELTGKVSVPGLMTYFRINNSKMDFVRNARYEPEQILVMETKAEVSSEKLGSALQVQLLPEKNPDEPKKVKPKIYRWTSAAQVTTAVRAQLTPVQFTVIPTEHEAATVHSFRLDVPPGRYLYLRIPKGLKSFGGYELVKDYETVVRVEAFPRELSIMSKGSILSYSGDRKIPLLSRNVAKVTFSVARILPEQLNQMVVNVYQSWSPDFSKPEFNTINLDTLAEKSVEKGRYRSPIRARPIIFTMTWIPTCRSRLAAREFSTFALMTRNPARTILV